MEPIDNARATVFERGMDVNGQPNGMEDIRKSGIPDKERSGGETSGEKWKTAEEDQTIPQRPKEAKAQPPPRPPSTYANDKPRLDRIKEATTEKGTEKGKGEEQGKAKERMMLKVAENR